MLTKHHKSELQALVDREILWDCRLDRFTSYGIGGPADALLTLSGNKELVQVLRCAEQADLDWRVIGRGTNLLVADEGFRGLILVLSGDFEKFSIQPDGQGAGYVIAGGGCGLTRLARQCAASGLSGLEFSCGIPGTLGGAVLMNAGAWGEEIGQRVRQVQVATGNGTQTLASADLEFGYRSFPGFASFLGQGIITGVSLELTGDERQRVEKRCRENLEQRRKTQPISFPNCGSFFKNPPDASAGRLIEAAGLKGTAVGGAQVAEQHANFLVNTGGATATEIRALMQLIQERVRDKFGIALEPEVHFL